MKYIHSFCIVFQVLKVLLIKIFKIQSPNLFLLFYISFYICRYPIAPHSEITNKNPEITMNFYNDLNNLLNQINNKSLIVLVAGDFNGETGKKTDIDKCLGNFPDRRRNQNGQHLINLCTNHNLLITNTCFRHKEKRLITQEQTSIVQGKLQKLKKTIDCICIPYK